MNELYYCCYCWAIGTTKDKAAAKPFEVLYHWSGDTQHCIHFLHDHQSSMRECLLNKLKEEIYDNDLRTNEGNS